MRVCERCGCSLEGRGRNARFCSRDCQVAAYRSGPSYRSAALHRTEDGRRVSIRLPDELADRLHEAAKDRLLSTNRLAVIIIGDGLDRLIPADELRLTRDPAVANG